MEFVEIAGFRAGSRRNRTRRARKKSVFQHRYRRSNRPRRHSVYFRQHSNKNVRIWRRQRCGFKLCGRLRAQYSKSFKKRKNSRGKIHNACAHGRCHKKDFGGDWPRLSSSVQSGISRRGHCHAGFGKPRPCSNRRR